MSLQEFVPAPRFEEYREAFKDFTLKRRADGVSSSPRPTPWVDRSS